MSLRTFLILFIIAFIASSCNDPITQSAQPEYPEQTTFIPYNADSLEYRAKDKSYKLPSEFGCSLSTLNKKKENKHYRYQAFYIQFPKSVVKKADRKVSEQIFMLRSDRAEQRTPIFLGKDGVVRYLTCRIPAAPKAVSILEKEMQKFGSQSWYKDVKFSNSTQVKAAGQGHRTTNSEWACQYIPGDGYGNTASTIYINGVPYTTYYYYEECNYISVDQPDSPSLQDDPFGGGGGGGNVGSGGSPDPCTSLDGTSQQFTDESGNIIGCGSSLPSSVITLHPMVKYPDGSTYAQDYPKLTEYLKNKLPTLKDNETIVNAIEKYGDLSVEDIKNDLQWDEGPVIEIKQLDELCGEDCYGRFSGADPNTLNIDIDLVNDLENTTLGTQLADSFSFLVGVTILHEYVHFSEWRDESWNSPESGILFEEDVYGQSVWRHNAELIIKGN